MTFNRKVSNVMLNEKGEPIDVFKEIQLCNCVCHSDRIIKHPCESCNNKHMIYA